MLNDECRTNDGAAGTAPAFCMEVSSSFRARHSPFSTPSRRRRGFTLLELVLVMVIIAVVLAMVAPSLSGFSAARDADYTASQVISVSRWAREQAISEGRVYRLNFNPSTQEYFVTAQVGGTFQRPPVEFGQVFTVPEGVVMAWEAPTDGGVAVIDFFPSGRSQPARIEVVARNGQVTSIASRSATEPLKVLTPEEAVAG
jgi:type II secretion system protein H